MKQVSIIITFLALLLATSLCAAPVSKIVSTEAVAEADRVIVPIVLNNAQEMAALDLPLEFSEGAALEEVVFSGTRSEDFDLAIANIKNDKNVVVIGLIPMVFGEKPDLAPGEGEIAKLVFRIDDPDLEILEIKTTVIDEPFHEPMFVYSEYERGQSTLMGIDPGFEGIVVELSGVANNDTDDNLPVEFDLKQNYPNPFNPDTNVGYDLPSPAHVKLEILNILGQKVATLVDSYTSAGSHVISWDGRNDQGRAVSSGVYFYRLKADGFEQVKKMMMLK
jgi:hypothetical protein